MKIKDLIFQSVENEFESLSEIPDVEYDTVVTMGCGDHCPLVRAKRREEWSIPDPKELPLDEMRIVRDFIQSKVRDLIAHMIQEVPL